MFLTRRLLTLNLILFSLTLFSQPEKQKLSLDDGPIQDQFRYLMNESNNYQEYKVVKKFWLDKLESNVKDTLKQFNLELTEKERRIDSQAREIKSLQAELKQANDSLNATLNEKNSMYLLGISMEKSSYKTIMWFLAGLLLLALLIFIFRFKNSNMVSIQAKNALADVEEEFAQYKKRSLEREQKLRRELQDEINKQRGVR